MRSIFDERLAEIHRELSQLGRMVNEAIYKSVKALINHDAQLAQEVIDGDLKINQKENVIDQKCYAIIALEQPNASDLRRVLAVMRASSDLERMGDHAENISKVTINVKGNKRDAGLEKQIAQIGDKINGMCSDIIDAFVEFDVDKAKVTAQMDDEVDEQYHQLRMSSIELMKSDSESVLAAADYSFVGMHLERIGDYITNIAEWIVYLDTGEIVDLD
ncbi:phosphate uptake regulator, PhoU [Atopostipes suicloacalis DSM 15692]|uniref:Phosphate-specific transport system accessory protein PhoU n=1 Tax=Atopostipes suicloacalis DSM 15692 TaxID=1121025 RepID=A0A1M4S5Y5_9LACT|nr:phosphate signaling complex protein PhoU [Atopostipes suicloacalis]SHE27618.1 phosphate uptake regulator, PhoU [Atopostipes suicloacalis DSM 15692]